MVSIGNIFIVGSIFFSFLTCIILFTRKGPHLFVNRLLSIVFFGFIWYSLRGVLDYTGWVRYIPSLLGFGIPLWYAVPPLGYIYTRVVLKQQTPV